MQGACVKRGDVFPLEPPAKGHDAEDRDMAAPTPAEGDVVDTARGDSSDGDAPEEGNEPAAKRSRH